MGDRNRVELSVLPPAPEMDLLLVKPHGGVSTVRLTKFFDEIGEFASLNKAFWNQLLAKKEIRDIAANLTNSLEKAAFKLMPEISWIKNQILESGCPGALMSGSGSAVFGILQDREQGDKIAKQFANKGYYNTGVVKAICEQSPIMSIKE
jgi:4-diphosphocytidyl-2-C-methyl-D-erythritol kinase